VKKVLVLLAVISLLIPISVKAQSTLALQEKCAEGAEKFVSKIQVEFVSEYHYKKKLDKCFLKVYFEKGTTLFNVFENKVVG